LMTPWGFFKYRWITVKWIITVSLILFGTFFLGPWINQMAFISVNEYASALVNPNYLYDEKMNMTWGSIQFGINIFLVIISVLKPWKQLKIQKTFKVTAIILILFLSCIFATSNCKAAPCPLTGKIIVIDSGHGGKDNGAIANGVREATINLAVGLKIRDKLLATGATVILTRSSDISLTLKDRVDISQATDADIFVSIHANTFSNLETAGAISFYQSGRPNNLAAAIQASLVKESGVTNKGVRPENFHVMRENYITAALIEIGFLTNAPEALRLTDDAYQSKVAEGISRGIINYLQSSL